MDRQTEMRSYDSVNDESIPVVVNQEPNNILFMLVKSLKCISSDIEHIKDCLETTNELYQTVDVLKDTVGHLVRQNNWLCESMKTMKKDLRMLRDKQTSSHKVGKQKVSNVRKGHKSTSDLALSQSIHLEEALQENVINFVEDLSFGDTSIPDKMIESECLSDDECASLLSKQGKDQIRCLLYKLMSRGPEKITTFLQILKEHDYERLTAGVYKSLDRINQEYKSSKIECVVCYIKKTVDLRDICDYLFHKKMIKREIYGAILEPNTLHANRDFLWSNIFDAVNMAKSIDKAIEHLIEALKGKYEHLTKYFYDIQCLQCSCHLKHGCRRRHRRQRISEAESQTDLSTTSDWSRLSQIEQNMSEVDSMSLSSLTDVETSFANLDFYRPKRQAGPCDSTTQDFEELSIHSDNRIRRSSEKFDIGNQTNSISDCKRQQSVPYIETWDDTKRPHFEQSISVSSTVTICPKSPTGSGDIFLDLDAESKNDLDPSDIPQSSINIDPGEHSGHEVSKSQDSLGQCSDFIYDPDEISEKQSLRRTSERSIEEEPSHADSNVAFSERE